MENLKLFLENMMHFKIINSFIIIILSIIIYRGVSYFLLKSEEKDRFNLFVSKKSKTYLKFTRNIIRYIFITITLLIILQINGIDVSSVLTGVGILGVVFGLAIQDWLKDIIRGSSILSDNYFAVGDVVKYKDIEGKVLVVGLKTTKIQELKTNNIISIANRNIEEIEIVSNLIYVSIPMPYEIQIARAESVISTIIESVKLNNHVDNCIYKGVNELSDSSIKYLIEVTCAPVYKLQVKRDTLRSILIEMGNSGINVPYTQIDIHTK